MDDWKESLKETLDEEVDRSGQHKSDNQEKIDAGEAWVESEVKPAFKEFAGGAEEAGLNVELGGNGSSMTVTHPTLDFKVGFSAGQHYGRNIPSFRVEIHITPQDGTVPYTTTLCRPGSTKDKILSFMIDEVKRQASFTPKKD